MLNGLLNYVPAIKYGNLVDNAELNPSIGQTAVVNLTSAQILTIPTVPVNLITTTAAGTMIIVDSLVMEFNATTTTYTGGSTIGLFYNGQTTTGNILSATVPIAFLTSSSLGGAYFLGSQSSTSSGITPIPNVGVALGSNATTNFATGTGTAKVFVNYYIVTI